MYAQPLLTTDLSAARITEFRRQAPRRSSMNTMVDRRRGSTAALAPRRRAGWWLVTVGLRLAVGPAQGAR